MPHIDSRSLALVPHPDSLNESIKGVEVQVSVPSQGLVHLRYVLRADMARIRVGPEVTAGQADELWRHTCFEAFVQPTGSRGYYEFNFAPTRQWAVYRFDSYRQGMTAMNLANPPEITTSREPDRLELGVTFPLPVSAAAGAASPVKLAFAAVIESGGGTLLHWAARHPQGKADFHHPDGFVFELQVSR